MLTTNKILPTFTQISFSHIDADIDGKTIATIDYNLEGSTQPWEVCVDGVMIHQANTYAKCEGYISYHYSNGTLPRGIKPEEVIMEKITGILDEEINEYDYYSEGKLLDPRNKVTADVWDFEGTEYHSESGLVRLGWKKAWITQLLPQPCRYAPNPHVRGGSQMKLYSVERILKTLDDNLGVAS